MFYDDTEEKHGKTLATIEKDSGRQSKLLSPEYKSYLHCVNQIGAGESDILNEWKILRIL